MERIRCAVGFSEEIQYAFLKGHLPLLRKCLSDFEIGIFSAKR